MFCIWSVGDMPGDPPNGQGFSFQRITKLSDCRKYPKTIAYKTEIIEIAV
jgi:hypothetical protein